MRVLTFRSGSVNFPAIALRSVDFPEPGGPSSKQILRGGSLPLMLSSIVNLRRSAPSNLTNVRISCKDKDNKFG